MSNKKKKILNKGFNIWFKEKEVITDGNSILFKINTYVN